MISVVLVEPEIPGNIGAVARLMGNFDVSSLVLVNPKCDHLSSEAIARAKHAGSILKKAKVVKWSVIKKFNVKVATTAIVGSDYNLPRSPLSPEALSEKLVSVSSRSKIAIIFGREGEGLSNKEIADCDFSVTILSSNKYRTLNLSHSVGIILYELFKKQSSVKKENKSSHPLMSEKEKEVILKTFGKIFSKLPFSTKEKRETQKTLWKRIIGKSFMTKREAFAVMGFLRKIEKVLGIKKK